MSTEHICWNISDPGFTNNTDNILSTSQLGSNSSNSTVNTTGSGIDVLKAVVYLAAIPLLSIIGIFGNISTIVVFFVNKQKHASSIFILGLAFFDLIFLVVRFTANVYSIFHVFFTETIRYMRPNSFFWFILSKTPQRVGNVFIILIVLERFTAVWFPFHVRQIWTGKRSLYISMVSIFLTLGDLIHPIDTLIFSLNERIPERGKISTDIESFRYKEYKGKFVHIWLNIYRIALDMLPIPIVFIFNILIIFGIKKNSFSKISNDVQLQRKQKEMRTTRMLLTISVLFVLLCGPFQVLFILRTLGAVAFTDVALSGTFLMLNILNSVINFIMYGMNDKSLRKNYLKIWKCQKIT